MRLLVLGGTAFLGRAVARHAHAAGHRVTCAARGESGSPPDGVAFVAIDRDRPDALAALDAATFDAVVDVTSRPSYARGAVAALGGRVGHWVYVSTGSVYADAATPGQRVDSAPVKAAAPVQVDDPAADEHRAYGPCKVACEEAVLDAVGPDRAFVCRPGLIVGPEDDSGRFTYWVERIGRGGQVLAPGTPDDLVQWVDVRDLAAWLVDAVAAVAAAAGVRRVPEPGRVAVAGCGLDHPGGGRDRAGHVRVAGRSAGPGAPGRLPRPAVAGADRRR